MDGRTNKHDNVNTTVNLTVKEPPRSWFGTTKLSNLTNPAEHALAEPNRRALSDVLRVARAQSSPSCLFSLASRVVGDKSSVGSVKAEMSRNPCR